ncbi:MAG: hypothetical protein ASARMPRED_003971 [Alectoria sarmentosa]|nr:MAG: hypothetical protein ASARMPRED_003971 [Alectoria sarmentosa]
MSEFFQILHEQYRTEHCGPWHTRECYPREYDVKAQECIKLAGVSDERLFFLQQAKILQDRAYYIRQEWARQEALQVTQSAVQSDQSMHPQSPQKKKRNEKTRQHNSSSMASSIKTTGLLSTIPALSWLQQPYHYTMLASPLAYIRYAEDMEATGQG